MGNNMIEVKKEAWDFLLYSYFGLTAQEKNETLDNFKKRAALHCAQRAYLDLARTLTFHEDLKQKKGIEEKRGDYWKNQFRNNMCKSVVDKILNDYFNDSSRHGEICKAIIDEAKKQEFKTKNGKMQPILVRDTKENTEPFYFGQAQKWLNMTLKYMRLLGCWSDEMELLKDELDIPVDSFIMEAASKEPKIMIPRKDGKVSSKYSESASKPWSQWVDTEYDKFQNSLRTSLKDKNLSPIDWEGEAWINTAEVRKQSENKKLENYVKDHNFE